LPSRADSSGTAETGQSARKLDSMPSARQQANGRQHGKSRAGKSDVPRPQRPEPEASQQRRQRSLFEKISLYSGIAAVLVAVVAAVFAILTYVNQRDTNQAASTATLEQYASKVSYVLETQGKNQELQITNRSIGAISNLLIVFPQPLQGCSGSCEGYGFIEASLSNIPACDVLTSDALSAFFKSQINAKSQAASYLDFTDQNENSWSVFSGEGHKLVPLPGYKVRAGLVTIPSKGFTQANGCS